MPFWPLQSIYCKSEAVLSKNFRHGHPGGSVNVFGEILISVVEVSLDEHIEIFQRERVTRRDLGNRATPVDRAHIKRPSSKQIYWGQISVFIVFQTFIREFWSSKCQLRASISTWKSQTGQTLWTIVDICRCERKIKDHLRCYSAGYQKAFVLLTRMLWILEELLP